MKYSPSTHNRLLPEGIKGLPMPESSDEALLLWLELEFQCAMPSVDAPPSKNPQRSQRARLDMPTMQTIARRNTETEESLDQIDPDRILVVDVENENTGDVVRRDCYDPGSEARMLRLRNGNVELRTLDWERSNALDP